MSFVSNTTSLLTPFGHLRTAFNTLSTPQKEDIYALFPQNGALVLGNVSESMDVCTRGGGGVFADIAGVRRIANRSIPMYFCAALDWYSPRTAERYTGTQSEALQLILGNYSEASDASNEENQGNLTFGVVYSTYSQETCPYKGTSSASFGRIGNWCWILVVGGLAVAVVA